MKQGASVKALVHIIQKIVHTERCRQRIEFQGDVALGGEQTDLGHGHTDRAGVNVLTLGCFDGQCKIARLAHSAVEHQGVCGAVAGKRGVGASALGVYGEVGAQVFTANINGGCFAVSGRLHLHPRHHWLKPIAATAGTEKAEQGRGGPVFENGWKAAEIHG